MPQEESHKEHLLTAGERLQDGDSPLAPSLHEQYLTSPVHISSSASYAVYQPAPVLQSSHPQPLFLYPMPSPMSASISAASTSSAGVPLTAIPMSFDTILLRASYKFSWTSWCNQYLSPPPPPPFASPHLPSYISPAEWSASITRLNTALQWPSTVQALRLVLAILLLLSFCGIWVKAVRKEKAYTVAVWSVMVVTGVVFLALTKSWGGRVRRALDAAVKAEDEYYHSKGAERQGRWPCTWKMEDRQLIISAPTVGPHAHQFPVTIAIPSMPPSHSPHDYQHGYYANAGVEGLHTPMAHY